MKPSQSACEALFEPFATPRDDGAAMDFGEDVRRLAARHGLTPSESEVVLAAMIGLSRREVVRARAVSVNTHKTQVRSALRRIGAGSLRDVRDGLLRERIRELTGGREA
jgi:DNA-binding CsgD family transcriptional regulator